MRFAGSRYCSMTRQHALPDMIQSVAVLEHMTLCIAVLMPAALLSIPRFTFFKMQAACIYSSMLQFCSTGLCGEAALTVAEMHAQMDTGQKTSS